MVWGIFLLDNIGYGLISASFLCIGISLIFILAYLGHSRKS